MKTKLSLALFLLSIYMGIAQAPVIQGDVMLCPNTNGTAQIINSITYETHTWYWKYWFTDGPFQPIEGANGASFTYDWFTYDQALLKVVVTLNGETYESNTIQIDSYAWASLIVGYQDAGNISFDPETESIALCENTTFDIEIYNPYSGAIQWYRNGAAIEGANSMVYEVSEAGSYHVVASPPFCPDNSSSSAGTPIVVTIDTDCNLATAQSAYKNAFGIFPNPVRHTAQLISDTPVESIAIYNLAGQLIHEQESNESITTLQLQNLASGVYIVRLGSSANSRNIKIIKE